MAEYFDDAPEWRPVREVGVGDPVTGGVSGTVNQPLAALAKRDTYLLERIGRCATGEDVAEAIGEIDLSPYAEKRSPVFTGRPQAPTAPQGTSDGQIATTEFVQRLADSLRPLLCPPGTMINFAGRNPPAGFLLCDGRAVSRAQYPALFAAIGEAWGRGDGSTTFNLPNAVGRFAEGAAYAGTYRAAGLPNITGYTPWQQTDYDYRGGGASGAFSVETRAGKTNTNYGSEVCARAYFAASRSSSVYGNSATVQPNSLTLLPCIKY